MNSGKIFILVGLALLALGLVLSFAPGLLSWFGRLPGDIRIDGPHHRIYFPITSMIVVSLALTLLVNLFLRR